MRIFRRRFASAFVPRPKTMADKMARQVAPWALVVVTFVFVQGCASDVPSQQASAYSAATGFLTLCDDADYDNALQHFAKPLKASPAGATWVNDMHAHRDPYGIPVIRSLVSRDTQKFRGTANEPAKVSYNFRTSFLGTTPGDEYVSVEKFDGKWQVYDYKFRPSGKPPAEVKAANELRKANIENGNIKKPAEERTNENQGY
jgi:hypothetical protein